MALVSNNILAIFVSILADIIVEQMYHIFHGKHLLIITNQPDTWDTFTPDFIFKNPKPKQIQEVLKLSKKATQKLKIALVGEPDAIFRMLLGKFNRIIAAGGLVFNEHNELLLIKRLGKWDLPKGKLEPEEEMEQCAIREVMEETNVQNLTIRHSLPDTFHTYYRDHQWIIKQTHWYAMFCEKQQNLKPQTEEDIEAVEWFPFESLDIKKLKTYPAIRYIIKSYQKPTPNMGL